MEQLMKVKCACMQGKVQQLNCSTVNKNVFCVLMSQDQMIGGHVVLDLSVCLPLSFNLHLTV